MKQSLTTIERQREMYARLEVVEQQMAVVAEAIELLTRGMPKTAAKEIAKIT